MPLSYNVNLNALLGASVLGIVCAATMFVVEHYRNEKRRHGMAQDLARLDSELSVVRRELDKLLAQQRQKRESKTKRSRRSKAESIVSNGSATDGDSYVSAVDDSRDSSDLEFYDVSDAEEGDGDDQDPLKIALKDIDQLLDGDAESDFDTALAKLQLLSVDYPENQQLMWRVGRAYYKLAMLKQAEDDKLAMRELIDKGVEACSAALDGPTPPTAEIHKWMAILVGSRSDLQSTKDRISDANVFKKHVDAALEITPDDPVLHHMLGRFLFEMANLKWYERKVAGALFGDLPPATVQDALDHFLKCARLQNEPWKNNSFFIGKCKINLGDIEEGVKHLEAAARAQCDNGSDDEIDKELKTLLEKYASNSSSGLENNHSS